MTHETIEPIVLAASSPQGYRPRLIEFYGYEDEDFHHFQEILESFLAINNITNGNRKLVILKSQLRAAKIFFENIIFQDKLEVTYSEALDKLKYHYITPELIQNYELEFNKMLQGKQEDPQIFLSRLREAADLANINSEAVIESRFRAGLLKEIKQFLFNQAQEISKTGLIMQMDSGTQIYLEK